MSIRKFVEVASCWKRDVQFDQLGNSTQNLLIQEFLTNWPAYWYYDMNLIQALQEIGMKTRQRLFIQEEILSQVN